MYKWYLALKRTGTKVTLHPSYPFPFFLRFLFFSRILLRLKLNQVGASVKNLKNKWEVICFGMYVVLDFKVLSFRKVILRNGVKINGGKCLLNSWTTCLSYVIHSWKLSFSFYDNPIILYTNFFSILLL